MKKQIKETILFIVLAAVFFGCMTNNAGRPGENSAPGMANQSGGFSEDALEEASEKATENAEIAPKFREDVAGDVTSDTASAVSGTESERQSSVFLLDYGSIPEYSGMPSIELNGNMPLFEEAEKITDSFEHYSELDDLGRCGPAYANLSKDTMPDSERGPMGSLKPSGWHTVKYNDLIEGNYLYNRCHLIGYQLAGENDNMKNLMTGTRYLNVQGMLPFENTIREYIKSTGNHVLYRVTPVFGDDNLVAYGVTMEGCSVEDNGDGICFFVYLYNVQPGIIIDYLTGDSRADPGYSAEITGSSDGEGEHLRELQGTAENQKGTTAYILNTNTHKFHYPTCSSVDDMAEKNKKISTESREELIEQGYVPCKRCKP